LIRVGIVIVAVTICGASALGGTDARQHGVTDAARANGRADAAAEADGAPVYSTAEDVLRALRELRPTSVLIRPESARSGARREARDPLFPEGWSMVDTAGRLVRGDLEWLFLPERVEGPPAFKLLENAVLEGMVRMSGGAASEVRFVVSGEVTVFNGANYLLPRLALRAEGRAAEPPGTAPQNRPPQAKVEGAGSTGHAASERAGRDDPSAEDVLAILQQETPERSMVPVAETTRGEARRDGPRASRSLRPDGAPLVDRPGRLISDGGSWTFTLEADSPQYPEPPLKLLPNRNLELMIEAAAQGRDGLVFVVSGEITAFEGENYVLARTVMRRIDSGNLRH